MMEGVATDWEKILGTWYEWMRIPSWFELPSFTDVTAEYKLLGGDNIQVINRAINLLGLRQQSVGYARIDRTRPGVLRISFFKPFESDYIVLSHKYKTDYDILIVGSSDKKLLWLLTRVPRQGPIHPSLENDVLQVAREYGYSEQTLQQLQITPITTTTTTTTTGQRRTGGGTIWLNNIKDVTLQNQNYRKVVKTGTHAQLVLMSVHDEIGLEKHDHVDQFIRVEQGRGVIEYGPDKKQLKRRQLAAHSAIFIPNHTWHNIINTHKTHPLKLYTLYSPPEHPPRFVTKNR